MLRTPVSYNNLKKEVICRRDDKNDSCSANTYSIINMFNYMINI